MPVEEPSTMPWYDVAIREACTRAEEWYRSLPVFEPRVNLGSVVGPRQPAILCEQDCVIHFARFLVEAGVPWEALHHEVSVSRWLFEPPHPAAPAGAGKGRRWRADLTLLHPAEFLAARLPATDPSFRFDACVEFAYLSDYWTLPKVHPYGYPAKGLNKVRNDAEKIGRYLEAGVCDSGYVIVFEEGAAGFPDDFVDRTLSETGCSVMFVRGY